MILKGRVKKLKIIIGEKEKVYQRPLYEAIVFAAKKYKLSGATVTKGFMSFGSDSLEQSIKVFAISEEPPIVIEIVDVAERIEDFSRIMSRLLDKAESGGIIFLEDVEVIRYGSAPSGSPQGGV